MPRSIEKQHPYWFYISGFNIAIIAALFAAAFSRLLGRRWGAVAAFLEIGLYTVLVGASFSVVRAALMGSFALIARQGVIFRGTSNRSAGIDQPVLLRQPLRLRINLLGRKTEEKGESSAHAGLLMLGDPLLFGTG